MRNLFLLFLPIVFSHLMHAQTFSGTGGAIPSNGTAKYFTLEPGSLGASTLDTNYGVLNVCINITHPNDADLSIALVAPDGTQVMLANGIGGDGNNFTNTCFDDRASSSIAKGSAPFYGSFRPAQYLGTVNNGQTGYATWSLKVQDLNPGANSGSLTSWTLSFGVHATGPFMLTSSNLPIVVINTFGQEIPDDPKIPANLKIYHHPSGARNYLTDTPEYDGPSGFELRGSSSQSFPKKSYGFESWDPLGNSVDTSFLGMPAESDWILNANYTDKSLMRNSISYQIWQNMGHYATRYHFVEVILNGEYQGVYIFSEKIKRDKNRVDIAKLDPNENTGDAVTGGYIFKIDKQTGSGGDGWASSYPPSAGTSGQSIYFLYDYPKDVDISTQQKSYIQTYVNAFETALKGSEFSDTSNGFRKYAVESTFIDYFLVNELSKNVDGYRLSTFVNKEMDSRGGKLHMGPVWDYDIAWHNANYCGGDVVSGWAYQFPCPDDYWQVPFWWSRLLQDPIYKDHLKCRYLYLRQNILSNAWFDNYLDSISNQLGEAQVRNFYTWPILGIYVWPNPYPYATTYEGEVAGLKSYIHNRLAWLDAFMPGTCTTTFSVNNKQAENSFDIYPNPVSDLLNIEFQISQRTHIRASVFNQLGVALTTANIGTKSPGEWHETIDMSKYPAGVYLLRITMNDKTYSKRYIKI